MTVPERTAFPTVRERAMQQVCGWSAVLLVFSAPVSRALFAFAGLLFLIGWVGEGRFRQKLALMRSLPVTAPLLLLVSVILAGAAFSSAPTQDVVNNLKVYSKLLLVLMLVNTLQVFVWRQRAWHAFVLAMALVLLSTYANVWVDLPWSRTSNQGLGADHSVFVEYVSQSVMTAVFLALCIQRALASGPGSARLVWVALAVAAVVSVVFLLQGRSGLVAISVVLIVMAASYTPRSLRWQVAAGLVALMIVLVISSPLMLQRVMKAYEEVAQHEPFDQTSLGLRMDMWRLAFDQFLANPLWGTGSGSYHRIAAQYFGHCEYTCIHPHQQYLFFAMEYGVTGLVAFLWLLWRLVVTARTSLQPERAVLFALVAVIAVDSLFNVPLWYRAQSYFFYVMLGLLLASNLPPPNLARPGVKVPGAPAA